MLQNYATHTKWLDRAPHVLALALMTLGGRFKGTKLSEDDRKSIGALLGFLSSAETETLPENENETPAENTEVQDGKKKKRKRKEVQTPVGTAQHGADGGEYVEQEIPPKKLRKKQKRQVEEVKQDPPVQSESEDSSDDDSDDDSDDVVPEDYTPTSIFAKQEDDFQWSALLTPLRDKKMQTSYKTSTDFHNKHKAYPKTTEFFEVVRPDKKEKDFIKDAAVRNYICNDRFSLLTKFENAARVSFFMSSQVLKSKGGKELTSEESAKLQDAALLSAELLFDCFNCAHSQVRTLILKDNNMNDISNREQTEDKNKFILDEDIEGFNKWSTIGRALQKPPQNRGRVFRGGNQRSRGSFDSRRHFKPHQRFFRKNRYQRQVQFVNSNKPQNQA